MAHSVFAVAQLASEDLLLAWLLLPAAAFVPTEDAQSFLERFSAFFSGNWHKRSNMHQSTLS